MIVLRKIEDWHLPTSSGLVYERLLHAIGTKEFGATVRDAVLGFTAGARRVYLFEAASREEGTLQYYFCERGLVELFPAYRKWYQRLDPIADAYRVASAPGEVALLRLGPEDITSSGFRRRFFDDAGIVERISVIQRAAGSWRVMNVARHVSQGCFSDGEIASLVGLACLALPMLSVADPPVRGPGPWTVREFEERFGSRFPALTPREREVCARAAVGMTVEETARDLGIAKTSVLTYRKRAYQRLKVGSPYELCSLVTS